MFVWSVAFAFCLLSGLCCVFDCWLFCYLSYFIGLYVLFVFCVSELFVCPDFSVCVWLFCLVILGLFGMYV